MFKLLFISLFTILTLSSCSSKFQAVDSKRTKDKTSLGEDNIYSFYKKLLEDQKNSKDYSFNRESGRPSENKQLILGISNDSIYTTNKHFKYPISVLKPSQSDSTPSNKNNLNLKNSNPEIRNFYPYNKNSLDRKSAKEEEFKTKTENINKGFNQFNSNSQQFTTNEEWLFLATENTMHTKRELEKPIRLSNTSIELAQVYLAYNTSNINFRESYIKVSPPNFPSVEKLLEPTTTDYGIDFGFAIGKEKSHIYLDSWFLSTTATNRGADYAIGASLGFGARYAPLKHKNHFVGWGIGIGGNKLNRVLYYDSDLEVKLISATWVTTPKIIYEYQIPASRISFFGQLRYVYDFGRKSTNSSVIYNELNLGIDGEDIRTTRYRFNSPYLEVDQNARLNSNNRFDLSFGMNYNF